MAMNKQFIVVKGITIFHCFNPKDAFLFIRLRLSVPLKNSQIKLLAHLLEFFSLLAQVLDLLFLCLALHALIEVPV
jgi:hypothetical protein